MANDDITPEPGTQEAMAAGHAKSQALVQGAAKVPPLGEKPRLTEEQAPEGEYTLLVKTWHQLTSAPGTMVKTFRTHHRGAKVSLNSEEAERLLRAGAVAPTTKEQAESAAAQAPSAVDKAVEINDAVGQKPIDDMPQAQPQQASTS